MISSCSGDYTVENGKVFYNSWNEGSGNNIVELSQADAKTFTSFETECDCNMKFGKDKNHLFINGKLIENIDPKTFKYLGNYIFRDKDSAYFFGFYYDINNCVIRGINPDDIKLLKYPWAKSKDILIHGNDTLSLKNIEDFIIMDENWGKTNDVVINENQILPNADPNSFQIISSYSGRDKNNEFKFGKVVK